VFSPKAAKWTAAQRIAQNQMRDYIPSAGCRLIWIHAASLGEYEQASPLISSIKEAYPYYYILLSFFSPSGYDVKHRSSGADQVVYLPLDNDSIARRFVQCYRPQLAIFIKYEVWYHYLSELNRQGIPYVFVATQFRPDQFYFRRWGYPLASLLKKAHIIFTPYHASSLILEKMGFQNITLAGDPRYDRVIEIARKAKPLLRFSNANPVIVAGSTWEPDESLWYEVFAKWRGRINLVLVPHETNAAHLHKLDEIWKSALPRLSHHDPMHLTQDILVVDSIGLLSRLYKSANIAYVGGGFGKGIHNTLEPAAYHIPVITGPQIEKFEEARLLSASGFLTVVRDASELHACITRLLNVGKSALDYRIKGEEFFALHSGGTKKIMHNLAEIFSALSPEIPSW